MEDPGQTTSPSASRKLDDYFMIASAPEMAAALRPFVAYYDRLRFLQLPNDKVVAQIPSPGDPIVITVGHLRAAAAALAKANGVPS